MTGSTAALVSTVRRNMVNENLTEKSVGYQRDASPDEDGINPPLQLALAYAPAKARPHWAALMQLDRRLARIVAQASEPMLAQIRLAWWREMFSRPASEWPAGEPLLAMLSIWDAQRAALTALADSWEAMVGEIPLPVTSFAALSDGRAGAMAGLAHIVGSAADRSEVERQAYRWSLADIAIHLSNDEEREKAMALLRSSDLPKRRLDRAMRPLGVLRVMAERAAEDRRPIGGAGDFLAAMRAGLTGR